MPLGKIALENTYQREGKKTSGMNLPLLDTVVVT
jgi:hypothetical protein